MDTETGFFQRYFYKSTTWTGYPNFEISIPQPGRISIMGRGVTPAIFDIEKEVFELWDQNDCGVDFDSFYYLDSTGNKWFGSSYGASKLKLHDQDTCVSLDNLKSVYDLIVDSKGIFWLCGFKSGLIRFDPRTQEKQQFKHQKGNPASLISDKVHQLYMDRNQNLWLASEGGASVFRQNDFIEYIYNPVGDNTIQSIKLSIDSSSLWLATQDQGIWQYSLKERKFLNNWTTPLLSSKDIRSILPVQNGDLWLATWSGKGIQKLSPEKNEISTILHCDDETGDWYEDLTLSKSGTLFFSLLGGGILPFDEERNQIGDKALLPIYQREEPIQSIKILGDLVF